jgi:hypothetical protein
VVHGRFDDFVARQVAVAVQVEVQPLIGDGPGRAPRVAATQQRVEHGLEARGRPDFVLGLRVLASRIPFPRRGIQDEAKMVITSPGHAA